ncbi:MAG: SymE family type I addiction module toxin [Steroidobacteraceae bacterium]
MAHTQSMPVSVTAQSSSSSDSTQIFTHDRQVRRYTVGYGPRSIREPDGRSAPVPMLRLQGAWLKRAGFAVGTPVTVRVDAGRLVIEATELEHVPQAEVLARVAERGLPKRDVDTVTRLLKRRHGSD